MCAGESLTSVFGTEPILNSILQSYLIFSPLKNCSRTETLSFNQFCTVLIIIICLIFIPISNNDEILRSATPNGGPPSPPRYGIFHERHKQRACKIFLGSGKINTKNYPVCVVGIFQASFFSRFSQNNLSQKLRI